MYDATNYISQFNEEYETLKNKIPIIFYMVENGSSRVLRDKENQLFENPHSKSYILAFFW